jgi:putative copper resistance protein D
MDEALYACRFVQFTAAMLIFGAAAFRVYAFADSDTRTASSILAGFDAWFWNVALAAALVALISAIALVPCQAAAMAGSPDAAVDFAVLSVVLLETRFGRVWCWHLLLAAILVLACLGRHPRRPIVLFLSLGLLASLGWVGHAAMDNGSRIAHELNQTGHLLAAGLWLGGLAPLAWVLRQAPRLPGDFEISLARDALRNFSHMGYVAVALIALTGAINTLLLVGRLDAMFDTPYGRLLAFKILLFLAMVVVALINRFRLAPRISRGATTLGVLGRTVVLEQRLGLSILAVVSVLGTWPPAIQGSGHGSGDFVVTDPPLCRQRRGHRQHQCPRQGLRLLRLCCYGGLTGVPQISISGATVDGLPIGLSIVGAPGSDAALVAVAAALAEK